MKNKNILDHVRVASPCHARWEDMAGDDRVRFCGRCQKNVFNFSAMTATEVEVLIREQEGRLCGRFYQRRDGRMLTADCPTGQRHRRNRVARWCGAAFAALMVFFGGRVALRSAETKPDSRVKPGTSSVTAPPEFMGEIAVQAPIMGDVCVSTNIPPPTTNPPTIMGRIYIPPATNAPAGK